jgi:hypothetical protein
MNSLSEFRLLPKLLIGFIPLLLTAQVNITQGTNRVSVEIDGRPYTGFFYIGFVQDCQQQVRHRRIHLVGQMPSGLELAAQLASHQAGQVGMTMQVAVPHASPYRIMLWSSKVPSPSLVFCSFCKK